MIVTPDMPKATPKPIINRPFDSPADNDCNSLRMNFDVVVRSIYHSLSTPRQVNDIFIQSVHSILEEGQTANVFSHWLKPSEASQITGQDVKMVPLSDIPNFGPIAEKLAKIRNYDEEMRPSEYACSEAYSLLAKVASRFGASFPRAKVTVGEDQNIYIYWLNGDDTVELTIPSDPSETHSIYVNIGAYSSFERDVNPIRLHFSISQLYQGK